MLGKGMEIGMMTMAQVREHVGLAVVYEPPGATNSEVGVIEYAGRFLAHVRFADGLHTKACTPNTLTPLRPREERRV